MSSPEEILLISRVLLLNDERAFGRLMKRYLRPVRRYFLIQTGGDEALSDDLTQETFTTFALCIGTVVLIVTQSRDVMDEYYEWELKRMLDAL